MIAQIDPTTPVLIGIGVIQQREDDPSRAREPLDLMIDAVRAAGRDCGNENVLRGIDWIAVPRGRWSYRNPAGEIARAIGAPDAQSTVSSVGVLQQSLIANACAAIASGEIATAIVTGADAGYRLLRARLAGTAATDRDQDDDPDVTLAPAAELRHPAELAAGLHMPVGLYAILDSAGRAAAGTSVDAHRDRLAALYARFSEIAAANPHAWHAEIRAPAEIRDESPRNPMQAFPYTKLHCSTWNVDQAAALLLCSVERAEALGIDRARWVFPIASAESNHMVQVCARADLAGCPGAALTAQAVLAAAGMDAADIDLIELYSCFPLAVECFAQAAGIAMDRDLTITGGMASAGGPYNNYFLQATARAVELLRAGPGQTALLSCVSGLITKQAFAIWSMTPGKAQFARIDVSDKVAAATRTLPVIGQFSGEATVAGYTVVYERDAAPRAVALIDTPDGERALATSEDADLIADMQRDEWVGRRVRVAAGALLE